jgi:hypothetical protein
MPPIQSNKPPSPWRMILSRVLMIVVLAALVGFTLNQISLFLQRSHQPAGFIRGMVQGALMPMSFPNLLVGNDVVIYSSQNTGVHYKLGYTLGVNVCGLIFFGFFFWRLRRLKKWAAAQDLAASHENR